MLFLENKAGETKMGTTVLVSIYFRSEANRNAHQILFALDLPFVEGSSISTVTLLAGHNIFIATSTGYSE